jgi:hypothetical protein
MEWVSTASIVIDTTIFKEEMMKKILIPLSVFLLIFSLSGQERTGNIFGKVVDSEGKPLPGVTVTLTGSLTAPVPKLTSTDGKFKFLSLSPGNDYDIKAQLSGFQTKTEQGLIVTVGNNIDVTVTLEVTALNEEVIVTAKTPVVDARKTSLGQSFTAEILQSLPTARDPLIMASLAPGIMIDRENVGGSESAGQALYGARGASFSQNTFSVDGVAAIDVSSRGMGNTYDFDSIEEININVGGNDVTAQTGGVALNMVTKRGGNNFTLGGRFYYSNDSFQSNNLTAALIREGVTGTNKINDNRDYGFNLGGPFIKDKAWFWLGVGVQDIKTMNILGTAENSLLTVFNIKTNFQILPSNRIEFSLGILKTEKIGRDASVTWPLGRYQLPWIRSGNPSLKIQDEHMFGDKLFVSAKFAYVESGYRNYSMLNENNEKIQMYNVTAARYDQENLSVQLSRAHKDLFVLANYASSFLGMDHDIKAGFEYMYRTTYTGSRGYANYNYNYNTATIDTTGDQKADIVKDIYRVNISRFGQYNWVVKAAAGYFQDTISAGRFNFRFGLRYDIQSPSISSYYVDTSIAKDSPVWKDHFTPGTAEAILNIFPPFNVPAVNPGYHYTTLSPRFGVTWDIGGEGKTIAKASLARYGDFMTTGAATYWSAGGVSSNLYFYWLDDNKDGMTDFRELYWANKSTVKPAYAPFRVFDDNGGFIGDWNSTTLWSGFDPAHPTSSTMPATVNDKNGWYGSTTDELILSLERQIVNDFGVALNFTYRKYYDGIWALDYYPDTGHIRTKDDYVQVGIVPDEVGGNSTESAAGRPYYMISGDQAYSTVDYRTKQPDFKQEYYGVDLVFNKRLSGKWMFNGSLTLQSQKASYGNNGYVDPTNLWATDNSLYAPSMGSGSGRLSQYNFSHWLVKFGGLYQLPFESNVSMTLMGREGYIIMESFDIHDYTAPNPRYQDTTIYLNKFGNLQLPNMWKIDLRFEKLIRIPKSSGRVYLMIDVFNLLNSSTVQRRYQRDLGTYYVNSDPSLNTFVPNPNNYRFNQILNPRILRFGARYQF